MGLKPRPKHDRRLWATFNSGNSRVFVWSAKPCRRKAKFSERLLWVAFNDPLGALAALCVRDFARACGMTEAQFRGLDWSKPRRFCVVLED